MDKKKSLLVAMSLFLSAPTISAHEGEEHNTGFSAKELRAALELVASDLETSSPELTDKVTAYKMWKDGDEANVRVYYTEGGQMLSKLFMCHKHDGLTECHSN